MTLFRWTLSFLAPYRRRVVGIVALSVLEIVLAALSPWALKLIVDNVLGREPFPELLTAYAPLLNQTSTTYLLVILVLIGFAVQLATEFSRMMNTQLQVGMGQHIVYDLRLQLLGHLQDLPLSHHVKTKSADSVYRLDADAYCVDDLIIGGLFPLSLAAFHLTVMFVVLCYLDSTLAFLALSIAPFLYASLRYYSGTMTDRAERVKLRESTLLQRVFETLRSIPAIKSFVREKHELDRFSLASIATMKARLQLTWQESLFSVTVTAITLAGTALVLAVGGLHVLSGTLTVGGLLVVIAYLSAVYDPVSEIARTTGTLRQALVSANRVREILALTAENKASPNSIDASNVAGHVSFENVSFSYEDSSAALKQVSFEAHPGELIALVGPTGAGKTTLANLIPRFFDPDKGRVLIDGLDTQCYSLDSLRRRVAVVPQEPILLTGTIADNIRYGRLDATDSDLLDVARAAHIDSWIRQLPFGFQTEVAENGATLSGGERQRLGIARALLKAAPIFILDEPTSAVDALSEAEIFETLQQLRTGRTIIVIAHRLSTVKDATKIIVMNEGTMSATGTHNELLRSSELYRRMCEQLSVEVSFKKPSSEG